MASLITEVNSTQATTTTWVEERSKDPFVDDPQWDQDGCLYNQQGELCLLSYHAAQYVRPPAWQKVEAWREKVLEATAEELAGEERIQRQAGLVDLANLPPSPPGDSESNLHDDTEEILQAALNIIAYEDDQSSIDTMVPSAAEENRSEAANHLEEDGFGTPTPIRGNFIPVSHPSPSSRHQLLQPAVYEPTLASSSDLVNSGVARDKRTSDKMASSTRSRSRSPVKQGTPKDKARRSRSLSPVKSAGRPVPAHDFQHDEDSYHSSVGDQSFTYGNSTRIEYAGSPSKLAQRRQVATPSPIDTIAANQQARAVPIRRAGIPSMIEHRKSRVLEDSAVKGPSSNKFKPTFTGDDDSSSTYSIRLDVLSPAPTSARPQPLFTKQPACDIESNNALFSNYQDWQRGRDLRNSGYGLPTDSNKKSSAKQVTGLERKPTKAGYRGEPYTPLDLMFPEGMGQRKASKTMIGAKGWLEDTTNSPEKKTPTSKKSFFTNFMSKAKAIMDNSAEKAARVSVGKPDTARKDSIKRDLLISLDPREQSLLYCELEFVLHQALNHYVSTQFGLGRLSTQKLDKISDEWKRKGRPKVVGFRYDLETQLDLIKLHMNEFKFYRPDATPAVLLGVIDMMRTNARAIKVRTYCQPDTVIAKQLLDSQNLFNILGCNEDEHIQLASITNFFKTIQDRERSFHVPMAPESSANATIGGSLPSRYGGSSPGAMMSGALVTPDSEKPFKTTPHRRRSLINRENFAAERSAHGSPYPWPGVGIDRSPLERLDEYDP